MLSLAGTLTAARPDQGSGGMLGPWLTRSLAAALTAARPDQGSGGMLGPWLMLSLAGTLTAARPDQGSGGMLGPWLIWSLAATLTAARPDQGSGGMLGPCPISATSSTNRERTVAIVVLLSETLRILKTPYFCFGGTTALFYFSSGSVYFRWQTYEKIGDNFLLLALI
jgi:hypothetical protein